jgi:hypothetical protein
MMIMIIIIIIIIYLPSTKYSLLLNNHKHVGFPRSVSHTLHN